MHLHHVNNAAATGPLSAVDARVKLAVGAVALGLIVSCKGYVFPLVVLGVCVSAMAASGVRMKRALLRFAEPAFIAAVVVIVKALSVENGLAEGLVIASRIMGAVSVVVLIGFITPFTESIAALAWYRVPQGFVEVLMFAHRFLFMLIEEAMVIYTAQKNRLGYTGLRKSFTSAGTLAGSLVLKALTHSQATATALAQRGYTGTLPIYNSRTLRIQEVLASLALVVTLVVIWWRV